MRTYGIGDQVAFKEHGVTREGRIVAIEDVRSGDRNGRKPGRWMTIRVDLFEDIDVPEASLGSILDLSSVC